MEFYHSALIWILMLQYFTSLYGSTEVTTPRQKRSPALETDSAENIFASLLALFESSSNAPSEYFDPATPFYNDYDLVWNDTMDVANSSMHSTQFTTPLSVNTSTETGLPYLNQSSTVPTQSVRTGESSPATYVTTPAYTSNIPETQINVEDEIDCGRLDAGPNITIIYSDGTGFGDVVVFTCPLGMRINGSQSARCQANGLWSHRVPTCIHITCRNPDAPQNGFVFQTSSRTFLFNDTITLGCDKGYSLQGYSTRVCQINGQWSGQLPRCVIAKPNICPEHVDSRGTVWNTTTGGHVATRQCKKGYYGVANRVCTLQGLWLSPVYNCVRKAIEELNQIVDSLQVEPSDKIIDEVLNNLTKETENVETDELQEGELVTVSEILGKIASASRNVSINKAQTLNFIKTASNLVDRRNLYSWGVLGEDQGETQTQIRMDGVMKAIDDYSDAITASPQGFDDFVITESNVDIKFATSVFYETINKILPTSRKEISISTGSEVNSPVLALKLMPYNRRLTVPLSLYFEHVNNTLSNPECSYWNFSKYGWDSEGCRVKATTDEMTECECDHLTNFAILMSPYKQDVSKTLSIITLVGCSISVLLLGVTLVIHVLLWRYVKSERAFILMNLVTALIISYMLFIFGVEETSNETACTVIAVSLHYFLLSVFILMLCATIEVTLSVVFVFKSAHRRSLVLLPVGWGIPAVIVAISAGMSQLDGYGSEDYCWLSTDNGYVWAFVGPAIFVISVNSVLLIAILRKMFGTRFMTQKSAVDKTKATVKCLCVLLPVMGITWIIGVFYINDDTRWIQYIFSIFNSLQGLVIFVFHCALNKQIHMAILRVKRKYSMTSSSEVKGSKTKSQLV